MKIYQVYTGGDRKMPSFFNLEKAERYALNCKRSKQSVIEIEIEPYCYQPDLYKDWQGRIKSHQTIKRLFLRTGEGYWFVERISIHDKEEIGFRLSDSVSLIIDTLLGADGGSLNGIKWNELFDLEFVGEGVPVVAGDAIEKSYQPRQVNRYVCRKRDGTERVIYSFEIGYFEGYQFDLFGNLKEARKALIDSYHLRSDLVLTECFECGAFYNELGHVEPGGMGCDRCNDTGFHSIKNKLVN